MGSSWLWGPESAFLTSSQGCDTAGLWDPPGGAWPGVGPQALGGEEVERVWSPSHAAAWPSSQQVSLVRKPARPLLKCADVCLAR